MSFFVPRFAFAPARCHSPATSRRDLDPFLSLLDDAFNEINRASARQQCRRPQSLINHRFDVRETESTYEVDGELPGFNQQDIEIEFTDDQTLVIKGKSEQRKLTTPPTTDGPEPETTSQAVSDVADPATTSPASETASIKSHHATVEDEFEDLGEDSSSTKGQDAISEPASKPAAAQPGAAPEAEQSQHQQEPRSVKVVSERQFGVLSRTFQFPVRLSTDAVTASFKNGVLTLVVPKAPVQEPRRIQVAYQ